MTQLEDISERLLTRSQEAILQLEIWIRRQQHLRELEDDSIDRLGDQYNIYIAQLNSLCIRSEYVRDKLNKERERRLSLINDRKYIENLVLEFQDITIKLNELAHCRSSHSTPCSKSTRSSLDSFQPRPLKLTERHGSKIRETRESPLKRKPFMQNVEFADIPESSNSKCLSLPGSPVKGTTTEKSIRMAKSYDTGLRPKKKKASNGDGDNEIRSFFKENQRLSISFFGEYDDDVDSTSDQDTVISVSPACPPKGVPLRRYNSHESIFSTKIEPINFEKGHSSFLLPASTRPSMTSARVSSAAVFSRTTGPGSSKDLLSTFIAGHSEARVISGKRQETKSSSFFSRWNLFGSSSIPNQAKVNDNASAEVQRNFSSSSSLAAISSINISPPRSKIPVFDSLISYDDLRDALDTELILAAEL
ncbi:hypothetical protein HG536_0B00210 [Torulaspora globosa]|uniref:Uncharacterized protein n=1 Tax=Torulaspora globosa TaxID=48254 RepID=A0A7G3ZCC4_9SACH|nr:uncharacterized protein HG536_0B00210 [Torulaspora globosa]QLL31160.1 hypothetical protein HG536_0B00210 [Torulaspora globosa]